MAVNINMQWIYQGKPVKELPHWVAGFVYEITNKQNGKKYIGIFETKNKQYEYDLKGISDRIKWIYRDDFVQQNEDLVNEIVSLVQKADNTYIFGAGEGKRMLTLRRVLKEVGFSTKETNLIGYWKK